MTLPALARALSIPRSAPAGRLRRQERMGIIPTDRVRQDDAVSHDRLFLENLTLIESLIRRVAWRRRLTADETTDLRSHVFLRLIENDYEVLQKFKGRSKIRTYLAVVIERLFQDYRNQLWGKWRASAEARRAGPLAEHLERLIHRDGMTFDEAVTTLRSARGVEVSRDELYEVARRFPVRRSRRAEDETALVALESPAPGADARLAQKTLRERAARARSALDRAVSALGEEDRVVMLLCFWEQMPIADIARSLGVEAKPLYRRIERLLARLRESLTADGMAAEVGDLLHEPWSDLLESWPHGTPGIGISGETAPSRPSVEREVTRA
jgi:RNA polymerase sigma factor (sigma-70 family)